jgi:two-component system response regulator FlrC
VFPLRIPPLRERRGDIVPLAEHLLALHCGTDAVPPLSAAAARFLTEQPWPGNVRELENVVQRALILRRGAEIGIEDLRVEPAEPAGSGADAGPDPASAEPPKLESSLRVSEGELILSALKAEDGRRNAAAQRLGISPRTLRYKLARLREAGLALP